MFVSRGDRDLGVAFQTHPGRQAFISSGSKEPRSALEWRRVSLGAHWVDSRESGLLRRLDVYTFEMWLQTLELEGKSDISLELIFKANPFTQRIDS